jgi:hypothetical protein
LKGIIGETDTEENKQNDKSDIQPYEPSFKLTSRRRK